jgi:hypothetical protein
MEAKNTNPVLRENEIEIRQTQLQTALDMFHLFQVKPTLREVLRLSQILTNFQYDWNLANYELVKFEKHFGLESSSKLMETIPHINGDKPHVKQEKGPSPYQLAAAKENKNRS